MVYASGKLNNKDILRIANEDVEVDHIINEKIEEIQHEQKIKEAQKDELQESYIKRTEENKATSEELSKSSKENKRLRIENEIHKLEAERSDLRFDLHESRERICQIKKEIVDIGKIVDYFPKAGRELLLGISLLAIAVFVSVFFVFLYNPQWLKAIIPGFLLHLSDTVISIIVSVVFALLIPICSILFAIITTAISGNPKSPREVFNSAVSNKISKYMNIRSIKLDIALDKTTLINNRGKKEKELAEAQKVADDLHARFETINSDIEKKRKIIERE